MVSEEEIRELIQIFKERKSLEAELEEISLNNLLTRLEKARQTPEDCTDRNKEDLRPIEGDK